MIIPNAGSARKGFFFLKKWPPLAYLGKCKNEKNSKLVSFLNPQQRTAKTVASPQKNENKFRSLKTQQIIRSRIDRKNAIGKRSDLHGDSPFFLFSTTGVGHNYWLPPHPLLNQKGDRKKLEVLATIASRKFSKM